MTERRTIIGLYLECLHQRGGAGVDWEAQAARERRESPIDLVAIEARALEILRQQVPQDLLANGPIITAAKVKSDG